MKCARFGSGSKKGTLTSPTITIDGDCILTFKVAPWSEESCSITISADNNAITIADTSFGEMKMLQWNTYQTEISGKGKFSLIFTPSQNRFFMDEVLITKKELDEPVPTTIKTATTEGKRQPTYTLDGRRTASGNKARGPIVVNGRKVISTK